ncbi:putative pre-mRNA-splicing factor ATP-dependent RNA helicase DEAH4 [Vitis vinifera]|uniref:RNA helicase n=1 Tax=Vitis vinifera TaxID=29760 RepID=A0A438DIP5_VITVI|nr:putative pre-mRNA-splicing factor ATP-dependent RNA helicase DEAH4 [Vitis vinifera]
MAKLPILQFEEKIIDIVEQNSVVVIIGETGSGKSTQLSQILYRRATPIPATLPSLSPGESPQFPWQGQGQLGSSRLFDFWFSTTSLGAQPCEQENAFG